jgi:hypothetical protein
MGGTAAVNKMSRATDVITITPQSSTIGAEISGIDLRDGISPEILHIGCSQSKKCASYRYHMQSA